MSVVGYLYAFQTVLLLKVIILGFRTITGKQKFLQNVTDHEVFAHVVRLRNSIVVLRVFTETQEQCVDGHLQYILCCNYEIQTILVHICISCTVGSRKA